MSVQSFQRNLPGKYSSSCVSQLIRWPSAGHSVQSGNFCLLCLCSLAHVQMANVVVCRKSKSSATFRLNLFFFFSESVFLWICSNLLLLNPFSSTSERRVDSWSICSPNKQLRNIDSQNRNVELSGFSRFTSLEEISERFPMKCVECRRWRSNGWRYQKA